MYGYSRTILSALGISLFLASWLGCAEGPGNLAFHPWWHKTAGDTVPGCKSPEQRMRELNDMIGKGPSKNPEEQQRVCAELAHSIEQEPDPAIRKQILKTINIYQTPLATAVLTAGLSDNEPEVRIACCTVWGTRGGPDAVQQLTRVLSSDTNVDVRLAAAKALGDTRAAGAIPPLAEALADTDPAMQHRLIESLKQVSGRDFKGDVNAWREYAKTNPSPQEPSVAERFRRLFY